MKYNLLFLFFISLNVFSQGKIDGFYRGQGNLTTVLGVGAENFNNYFAGKNKIDLSREGKYINLFASYGLSENLDAQVSLPYIENDRNKDFQDLSLFLKYRFYKTENNNLELSLGLGFSTPVSDYDIGGLYDIGQQTTTIDTRFMIHYKWQNNLFITIQSGYDFKFDETPNSLPFTLKVGQALNTWYYDIYYDYQYAFGGADYRGTPPPKSFSELGVSYNKIGGTLYKSITLNFGGFISYSNIISGRNTFQGNSFGLGLVYNFIKQ